MKIRTKLLLLAAFTVLMVSTLVGLVYFRTTDVTTRIANDEALATVRDQAKMIDLYINGIVNIGENAAHGLSPMFADGADRRGIQTFLADIFRSNANEGMLDAYVGLEEDGSLISGNGDAAPDGYDARTRPWYRAAASGTKTVVTEPYVDEISGSTVLSVVTPIFGDHQRLLGVLGADIVIEELAASMRESRVLDGGYGILLARDGTFLEFPDSSFVMKENVAKQSSVITPRLVEIGMRMLRRETGMEDFYANGEHLRVYFAPSRFGFIAGLACPVTVISDVVGSITKVLIASGAVAVVIALIWMALLIPSIVRPLKIVEKTLARIASFDLTTDTSEAHLEARTPKDTEIGAMLASLSTMRVAWNGVVSSVRTEVDRASDSASRLDDLADRATGIVNDTKDAIDSVDGLANSALKRLQSTTDTIAEVSESAGRNSESASEAAEAAQEMSGLSTNVHSVMNSFVEELRSVGASVMQNSEGMNVVGTSVESITEFVGTIEGIASQTDLLALNAAIEAARAGEAGRGFAVVAEQVKKLAAESNSASHRVAELIEDLSERTTTAIESTKQSAEIISEIVDKAIGAQKSLNEMITQIDRMTKSVQSISAAAHEQTDASRDVANSATDVRESVENVVHEISVVAGSTGGTVRAMQEVNDEALKVAEISRALAETMKGFKTA